MDDGVDSLLLIPKCSLNLFLYSKESATVPEQLTGLLQARGQRIRAFRGGFRNDFLVRQI